MNALGQGLAGRSVVVAGGGIGGLAAAVAAAQAGAQVTVIEQAPEIREVGAGLQVTPNGGRVLAALGLSEALADRSVQARAIQPTDAVTGRAVARMVLPQGAPGYRFVHRADLIDILHAAARTAGVAIRLGQSVATAAPDGHLTLASGESLAADLVIGADGIKSVVRGVLNGADRPFFTGQVAWRAVVPGRADDAPVARIWMAPGRHVVTYPLTRGRLNIVAVREQADWAPEGWSTPDAPEALGAVFADLSPDLRAILGRVTEVRLWGLFRHPVAPVWQRGALALLGDAAHPTLPFLAQGANLALEDAWVLVASAAQEGIAAGLPRYQALRQARVARAIATANRNAVNYHLSGPRRRLAHLALRGMGAVAPGLFLRRFDWLYGHDVTA